ncbi:hypothetical protein [Desulfosporosinus fructosivorans]
MWIKGLFINGWPSFSARIDCTDRDVFLSTEYIGDLMVELQVNMEKWRNTVRAEL